MGLSKTDIDILALLSMGGGWPIWAISQNLDTPYSRENKRMRSAAVRSWVNRLSEKALVAPMDDQKPTCWILTKAGVNELAKRKVNHDRVDAPTHQVGNAVGRMKG